MTTHLTDDGTVCGDVRFQSSNKDFLYDIRSIAISLGYKCTNILSKNPKGSKGKHLKYSFKIRAETVGKFFDDLEELIEKYPTCNPGYEFDEIRKMVRIERRRWKQRGKGETKYLILRALHMNPKTAFELRDMVNVSLWTVYHHLQDLIEEDEVKRIGVDFSNRTCYSLKN